MTVSKQLREFERLRPPGPALLVACGPRGAIPGSGCHRQPDRSPGALLLAPWSGPPRSLSVLRSRSDTATNPPHPYRDFGRMASARAASAHRPFPASLAARCAAEYESA